MKSIYALLIAATLLPSVTLADDISAGESLYNSKGCIGCHGAAGKSANPDNFPALAGKEAAFLKEQIIAFRDYKRENPMMNPMVQGLSDEQAGQIGAYLAAQ
ncbi:MAG: c-type cytochrome [Pseudomonadota bacterium]